ncbi:MAG: ABC transporter permease [Nitrososphaera sp.]|jgi:peptide/nickel transport system permease protein
MSIALSRKEIVGEFRRSKSGIAGITILAGLLLMTAYSLIAIPLDSFRQWNNPNFWIDNPKSAAPAWTNLLGTKAAEHVVLRMQDAKVSESVEEGVRTVVHSYSVNVNFDEFPSDFMLLYAARYGDTQPALQVDVDRPDGRSFRIYFDSLPPPAAQEGQDNEFSSRVFSTDGAIASSLADYQGEFAYDIDPSRSEVMIFSDAQQEKVLKGTYVFRETFYLFEDSDSVTGSGITLGGRVFGLMGTDEQRRDLATGILWATPVALFIGLTVSIASILIGLVYGVVAGYRGKRTDEGLMRINDIFYSLPTLPLLVILSVTVGRSILLITGFLVIFGWVGMAKISRSLALQIKNLQYVEAAKLMGQSDAKIIFRHIIPQLLPLTFASIAIAVPGAILGEAALSFLGLGDPSIPTWGQILHDANSAGAAVRGLWWGIIPPGVMIALTGLAFALIGNALDAIVNPRSKRA